MNRKNAVRAARTAATGAENGGRMDSYFAAEEMGIKIEKQWLATLDGRTRDSHADLDGKHVPNDEAFDNGLMYPGDPSGYASEVYNCRCTMIAYYPEYPSTGASGRARDPETGENVLIEDMTYSEWAGWKSNKVQSVDDIMGEKISPVNILPVNQITDYDKFAALAYDFSHSGYSGRPIVAGELGDGTYQALTGSHRIFAAREANIDIPTVTLKYNDDTRELFEAIDDESRVEIVEILYKQGKIDKDVYRLMTYEDEANFTVSEEYAKAAKKKAELWQAEKEAKKKAEIDAQEAAKKASEKKREEFAKQRAESEDMKIYKEYYEEMKKKYGEEHMYRDMTSQEYDKIERLERIAYTGK